jgi:hypothetical protein
MYQLDTSWVSSSCSARGVGRRSRARNQWSAWSRHGPEIDVKDVTRPRSP